MRARLIRPLHGARDAPARWEALCAEVIESSGFARCKAGDCCVFHKERGIRCAAHGDYFTCTGYDADLGWAQQQMDWRSLCNVGGRLGGWGSDVQDVRLVNRITRWDAGGRGGTARSRPAARRAPRAGRRGAAPRQRDCIQWRLDGTVQPWPEAGARPGGRGLPC